MFAIACLIFMFFVFMYLLVLFTTHRNNKPTKHIPSYKDCRTCENFNYGTGRCYLGRTPDCCGRWEHIDDDYYLGVADD